MHKPNNVDLTCRICLDTISEAFMTQCGHSFCFKCITRHLSTIPACPICQKSLSVDQIYPNFILDQVIRNNAVVDDADPEAALEKLVQNKRQRERSSQDADLRLLNYFLMDTLRLKQEKIALMQKEVELITKDLAIISVTLDGSVSPERSTKRTRLLGSEATETTIVNSSNDQQPRVHAHLDDLQDCYFSRPTVAADASDRSSSIKEFASTLQESTKFSRFRTLASLHYADTFFSNSSSIVSSLDFDKDDEYFASAGVTRKVKIFEYSSVVSDVRTRGSFITSNMLQHPGSYNREIISEQDDPSYRAEGVPKYPSQQMACNSKISCLSWNAYIKPYLASSDYEGIVSLWDVNMGKTVHQYEEHEKRAWTVDFSSLDPTRLASGGDDAKVKVWSTNQASSCLTIETRANVCSVKFHPTITHHLGSADHFLHYYDIRNPNEALHIYKGHKKAVSYVKFLNPKEMVSASTDCSLRLWSLADLESREIRTFTGHCNEKNFVGLSVNCNGSFIACGSETNGVFAYYNKLTRPVISHSFGNTIDNVTVFFFNQGLEVSTNDPNQFVSSVCWKRKSPDILLCANSQGRIKVLELV